MRTDENENTFNKKKGYGSTAGTVTVTNENHVKVDMIEGMHESLIRQIQQIRLQSQNNNGHGHHRPIRANLQIMRSGRRSTQRRKSESDYGTLINDEQDVQEIRNALIRRYGTSTAFPPQLPLPLEGLKEVPKLTGKQKLVLVSMALVDFTSCCAMSILAPFFPQEAAKKDVPTSISGFVFSIYALVVFIFSPLMGNIVGQVGPKFMLIIGIILAGCCNILFGLLDHIDDYTTFVSYCLVVRVFEAMGAAMIATSCYTFVAQIFPDSIGSVLGILEIFVGLGLSVGPALGGLLYDLGGYGLPFFFLGLVMLLTIPINVLLLPSSGYQDAPPSKVSTWSVMKLPPVIIVCLVVVVNSNTWGFLSPTLEPHLREFNLSAKQLGLFFLLSSVLYAASSPLWGRLADKTDRTWILMVIGLLSSGAGLLLIGPSPLIGLPNTIWINIVALIILGTSVSMALLPTFEALLDFAVEAGHNDDISTYGVIGGIWSSMESLGEVTGPSLGGFLMDNYGFPVCSTVMAGLCIFMGLFVLVYFLSCHPNRTVSYSSLDYRSVHGRDSKEKLVVNFDSGISSSDRMSNSSLASTNSLCIQDLQDEMIINEKSPLLSKSLNANSNNNNNAQPVQVPVSTFQKHKGFCYSPSVPKILKTVSVTKFGAVEV